MDSWVPFDSVRVKISMNKNNFTGMQRLSNEYISSVTENKNEGSTDVPRVLKNDLYEKLPDTSETKQIKAVQRQMV